MVLPQLTRDELRQHLLPIDPTELLDERRAVTLRKETSDCSSASSLTRKRKNHYLLLIPVTVCSDIDWGHPCDEFVGVDDMIYIAETVTALQLRSMTNSYLQSMKVDEESLTASSIPVARPAARYEANGPSSDDEVSTGSSISLLGFHRSDRRGIMTMIELSWEDKISDWFKKNDSFDLF